MNKIALLVALALVLALTVPAAAEVEEITVGGSIVIQGEWQGPGLDDGVAPGAGFIMRSFDDDIDEAAFYSQRTRVNVDAKLSGGVRGFVELQSYDIWGDEDVDGEFEPEAATARLLDPFDFPSTDNVVTLYQAFIEVGEIADYPLSVRAGRQELVYGDEWLVGNNDAGRIFNGLSFDGIKLMYADDMFAVDAWTVKLVENSVAALPTAQNDDVDFYGIYGTYMGIEDVEIDGYLLYVRDASEVMGDDTVTLYTVGSRVAGTIDAGFGVIDLKGEAAFQFGDTADDGDFEGWGLDLMAGMDLDMEMDPRVEIAYTFFSGDDDDDNDEETFVRMFSDVHYGELNMGGFLDAGATNLHIIRGGVSVTPAEKLEVSADLYYFMLDEDDTFSEVFGVAQAGDDDEVGIELDLAADYQYTEDLNIRVGWAHFFVDDATENSWGVSSLTPTKEDDDVDYLYVRASLDF